MGFFDDIFSSGGGDSGAGPLRLTVTPQRQPDFAGAIAGIESGGQYDALGPVTRSGDRAFGKYQVMGANIPEWTKETLGRPLTPQEFLASPEAQDAVFNAKFGGYVQKYGPAGAAKAWFAGERGMNNPNARDALGTTVQGYADRFTGALGRGQAASAGGFFDDIFQAPAPAATAAPPAPGPTDMGGYTPQQVPQTEGVGAGTAFSRGLAQGATANWLDEIKGFQAAGAGAPNIAGIPVDTLLGLARVGYEAVAGRGQATQNYEGARDAVRADTAQAEAQYPGTTLAGNIAGAVAIPVGSVMNAATLPARIGRSALVGAGYGGLAGAGEGEGAADSAQRAATGAAVGGAVGAVASPVVEGVARAGQALTRPVVSAVRGAINPEAEASRRVVGAVQRGMQVDPQAAGRVTPAEFAASASQGGPVQILDLGGESTRALARSAANTSPEGRAVLDRAINNRFEGQAGRVNGWLNDTFNYPNAQAQQAALDQVERAVNRAAYARAYREGDRQLWSPELERIVSSPAVTAAMREAVTSGKDRAVTQGFGGFNPGVIVENGMVSFRRGPTGQPTYPNLQFWDATKRALDDSARAARRAGRNEEAAVTEGLARQLRGELDNLVPSYANARAGAASFFGAENALEAGQNFVTSKLGNREARAALARMTPQERQLFQDGFVSRYIEMLNEIGDRRSILNTIASTPAARERLNIALGPQRSAQLEAGLRVESIMDRARTAVQGNSTTARQLAELGFAGGAGSLGAYGTYNLDPSQMTYAAIMGGLLAGRRGVDQRVARRVAEMLSSNDPQILRRGIALVSRSERLLDGVRAADNRIARLGGGQGASMPPLQSPGVSRADDEQQGVPRPPGQ